MPSALEKSKRSPRRRAHARGAIVRKDLRRRCMDSLGACRLKRRCIAQRCARLGSISEDPIGFAAGDANLYRYVGNQAATLTDPSGLEPPIDDPFDHPWAVPPDGITIPRVPDESDGELPSEILTGTLPLGLELLNTGNLRLIYERSAAAIGSCDATDAEKKAMRDALKNRMRELQTRLGKSYTESLLRQREREGFQSGKNNAGKTNARVNRTAKVFRVGGRMFIAIGIGTEIYTVASADNPLSEAPRSAGRIGGAFGGAAIGAELGSPCGPYGVAAGGLIGGVAGSSVGEGIGEIIIWTVTSEHEEPYEGFWDDVYMP